MDFGVVVFKEIVMDEEGMRESRKRGLADELIDLPFEASEVPD